MLAASLGKEVKGLGLIAPQSGPRRHSRRGFLPRAMSPPLQSLMFHQYLWGASFAAALRRSAAGAALAFLILALIRMLQLALSRLPIRALASGSDCSMIMTLVQPVVQLEKGSRALHNELGILV